MIESRTILTRRSIFRAGAGLAVAATATPFLTPASAQAKDAPQAGAESIQMAKDTHVTAPTRFVELAESVTHTGVSARRLERRSSSFNTSAAALKTVFRL